jgi:cell division protein FtsZ
MVKEGLINLDFADVRSVMREMGRAMMGTGESSGEGRAMNAAEAAIANPLLDETSMAGANGLLISITGGRDMTLFEVDEAATRIREEVDQEANIILGATFDESLEGVIRVSVVATGIEKDMQAQAPSSKPKAAENAHRVNRITTQAAPATAAAASAMKMPGREAMIEKELEIARPVASDPKVTIAPFKPENAIFSEPVNEDDFAAALASELDEPSVPEMPIARTIAEAPTMPKVEDFPPIAQQKIASPSPVAPDERGPIGLLKRIANGLGATEAVEQPKKTEPAVSQHVAHAQHQPVVREDNNPYAPPRSGSVDSHGRQASHTNHEDDQLDIPAFLRRQSN